MSLGKYSIRSMKSRPGRTILTLLSIVFGTAAVVSIMLTTATTRSAYKQMFSFVTGRAALEVATEGEGTLPQGLAATIGKVPGVKHAVPVYQRLSVIYGSKEINGEKKRVNVQLIGIDLENDSFIREYTITKGKPLGDEEQILVDEVFARRLQLEVGDEVRIGVGRTLQPVTIAGFLQPKGRDALRSAGIVLYPLQRMQNAFSGKGKVTAFQVVVDENARVDQVKKEIASVLPQGASVRAPVADSQQMQELLAGNEKVSQLVTVFTLVLAMFIILNTFLMNISERRRQLAILRAIGATRKQIMRSIIGESLFLGVMGTLSGMGFGVGLAWVLNLILAHIVLDIAVPNMQLSWMPFILAGIVGLSISVVGAMWPAYRAGKVSPLEGMSRVSKADSGKSPKMMWILGLIVTLIGVFVIGGTLYKQLQDSIKFNIPTLGAPIPVELDVSILGGVFLLIGFVMTFSLVLKFSCAILTSVLRPFVGMEIDLAVRQVLRHLTRSALTTGVVFVAGSTGLAIAYTIIDNVNNVHEWRQSAIIGDFFMRSMMPNLTSGENAHVPLEVDEDLQKVPHLQFERISFVNARSGEDSRFTAISREFPDSKPLPFDLVSGDKAMLRDQLKKGQVILGSVLSQRLNLKEGDKLKLETVEGPKNLRICGVTNDYLSGGLSIYLHRDVGNQLLGIKGTSVFAVTADKGHLAEVKKSLEALSDKYDILLHSNEEIGQQINSKVIGIDSFLWALLALEFAVAAFGVVNTLTMNVLEQTREIGLLRIVAMTKTQVRRTILAQAFIIAMSGMVPGILFGLVLAYVMNLATLETTGHAISFGVHPFLTLGTFFGAMLIMGIAAWIPARRAANLDMVEALQCE